MSDFSQEELRTRFEQAFPDKDERLLGVYKRQLWDVIEEMIPTRQVPEIAEEVRLWQRIWLAILLHQRGQAEIAEVLWYQALYRAVELEWYETALWLFFLLEGIHRNFCHLPSYTYQANYINKLRNYVSTRYAFLSLKSRMMGKLRYTENKKVIPFPDFIYKNYEWNRFIYDMFNQISLMNDIHRVDDNIANLINNAHRLIKKYYIFPSYIYYTYIYISIGNIAVIMLNCRMIYEYEKLYKYITIFLNSKMYRHGSNVSYHEKFLAYNLEFSLLYYYIILGKWKDAYDFVIEKIEKIKNFIFESSQFLILRAEVCCRVYFILLLIGKAEEYLSWKKQVESWLSLHFKNDLPYFWWNFLQWYRFYREKDWRALRWSYRRLRRLYKTAFSDLSYWRPIFAVLWRLSFRWGLRLPRRAIHRLLHRWEAHPEERRIWDLQIHIFPMRLFIESVQRGVSIEVLRPDLLPPVSLTPDQRKKIEEILYVLPRLFSSGDYREGDSGD
ncbi:MAG: hypothetical protein KatS3mg026_0641 [Bacteroidia bacterium]|nr:MAG: hypothetical protein KatS3mg026_0641 [Bacteroidia bacterium]